MMNGYDRRTNTKKAAIINAARELFTVRGFTDVGIGEIASKARVSQVTIYNYFGDKSALARESLALYLEGSIHEFEKILAMDISFDRKLKGIMDIKHDMVLEIGRLHVSEKAWEDKALQQVFKDIVTTKARAIFARFIELGKEEGMMDESIPSDAILAFLFSSIPIMQDPNYLNTSNEYKMGIMKLFLYGLLGRGNTVVKHPENSRTDE